VIAGISPGAEYAEFLELIATLAGATDDRRDEGEILYAGWRAIQPPLNDDGVDDMSAFFKMRDAYEDNLNVRQRTVLREERESRMDPVSRTFEQHLGVLRPYFEVRDDFIAQNPGVNIILQQLDIAERVSKDSDQVKFLRSLQLFRDMNSFVRQEHLLMRDINPLLDGLLRYWGYIGTSRTNMAAQIWKTTTVP